MIAYHWSQTTLTFIRLCFARSFVVVDRSVCSYVYELARTTKKRRKREKEKDRMHACIIVYETKQSTHFQQLTIQ